MATWNAFVQFLSHLSYFGVGTYMGTVGYVIPIPEEAALIILGFLAGLGKFQFWYIYGTVVTGILIGDNIFYWLSYYESKYILHFKKRVRQDVWQKYEKLMKDNIGKTMVALRFLVGFRFLGPVIAGSLKVKYRRFFAYDTLLILFYSGSLIYLGFFFRRRSLMLIGLVEHFRNLLLSLTATVVVILLLGIILKRNSDNR